MSKVRMATVAALLLAAISSVAKTDKYYEGDHYGSSSLTFSQIEALLSKQPRRVEDFLAGVDAADPTFFSYFTLMRHSSSLQESTPLDPRVIAYGSDAKMILTFNGGLEQKKGNTVELMHFREDLQRFEFREIIFTSAGPQLSVANPPRCMQCHTKELRPIWEGYQEWPGAYGQLDDVIPFKDEGPRYQELMEFWQHAREHGRYQFLKIPEGSRVSPYSEIPFGDYAFRPNLRLLSRLTKLHLKTLLWQILSHPLFPVLKNEIFDEIFKCQLPTQRLIDDVERLKSGWLEVGVNTDSALFMLLGIDKSFFNLSFQKAIWTYNEGNTHLEDMLWEALEGEFARQDAKYLRPRFQGDGEPDSQRDERVKFRKKICEDVEKEWDTVRSFEKIKADFFRRASEVKTPPQTIQMCMSCHSGAEDSAPYLPLDRPDELKKKIYLLPRIQYRIGSRLQHGDYVSAEEQMPPGRPLGPLEIKEIEDYLKAL